MKDAGERESVCVWGGAYVTFFANLQAAHVILQPIIHVRVEEHQDGSGSWLFVCGRLELYSNNAWVPAHTGQESKTDKAAH